MRAYQQVLARIEQDLFNGRIGVGGRLPAERALAERYAVSRASVREAIKVLEAMGIIRTGVGSGPDAGAVVIADPSAPIAAALRWHLASRHLPVGDLVGVRVLLESWSVQTVAEHIRDGAPSPETGAEARELLREMEVPETSAETFLELDTRFHVALAEAAGNTVVSAVMQALRQGIQAYVTDGVSRLTDWPAMAARLRSEHSAILSAVEAGEPAVARAAVVAHITGFYADTGVG